MSYSGNIIQRLAQTGQLNNKPLVLSTSNPSNTYRYNGVINSIMKEPKKESFNFPRIDVREKDLEEPVLSHSGNLYNEIGDVQEELDADELKHSGAVVSRGIPTYTNSIIITKDAIRTFLYIVIITLLILLFIRLYYNQKEIQNLIFELKGGKAA